MALLTFALLSEDPLRLAGERKSQLEEVYSQTIKPAAHLLFFMLLGFLGMPPNWRLKRHHRLLLLAAYAVGTEALQALIPRRTPEWSDVAQNLAGLALGAGVWWAVTRRNARRGRVK